MRLEGRVKSCLECSGTLYRVGRRWICSRCPYGMPYHKSAPKKRRAGARLGAKA
jgi:hypothetical protein